ncbi:MAG: hypothetical protein ACYT04_80680 [Nostoc sp.]
MTISTTRFSETYRQLFRIFESLEKAHFVPGTDFGENLTGCFQWFISPSALVYLEIRGYDFWKSLKQNQKVLYKLEPWQGFKTEGANISLK